MAVRPSWERSTVQLPLPGDLPRNAIWPDPADQLRQLEQDKLDAKHEVRQVFDRYCERYRISARQVNETMWGYVGDLLSDFFYEKEANSGPRSRRISSTRTSVPHLARNERRQSHTAWQGVDHYLRGPATTSGRQEFIYRRWNSPACGSRSASIWTWRPRLLTRGGLPRSERRCCRRRSGTRVTLR
jgi:hypothetical protein